MRTACTGSRKSAADQRLSQAEARFKLQLLADIGNKMKKDVFGMQKWIVVFWCMQISDATF